MPTGSVVDAAATLLREGGVGAVTTRAVAAAAGIPAPTIFRVFGDKDGLMEAVAERVLQDYVDQEAAATATDESDPVEQLRTAWRTHVSFGLANPDAYRLLFAAARPEPSRAALAGFAVLARRVQRLAEAGRLRMSVERAVSMIHAAGTGVVLGLLAQPADRRDPGLSEATFDALLGGLLVAGAAPPDREPIALAVAFGRAVPDLPALSDAERTLLREWLDRAIEALQD